MLKGMSSRTECLPLEGLTRAGTVKESLPELKTTEAALTGAFRVQDSWSDVSKVISGAGPGVLEEGALSSKKLFC